MFLTVFCIECRSIFEQPDKKPCAGRCAHNICSKCFDALKSPMCSVCFREDSFQKKNFNRRLENTATRFKNYLASNHYSSFEYIAEWFDGGECSGCRRPDERRLKLCVDCVHKENAYDVQQTNDGYKVVPKAANVNPFLEVKRMFVCGECAHSQHAGHKIIGVNQIENILNHMIKGMTHTFNEIRGISPKFDKRHGMWANVVAVHRKDVENVLEWWQSPVETRKGSARLFAGWIAKHPEVRASLKRAEERIAELSMRNERLEYRFIRCIEMDIEDYMGLISVSMYLIPEKSFKAQCQAALAELRALHKLLPTNALNDKEFENVDEEVADRLETLENGLATTSQLAPEENPRFYRKYRVVVEQIDDYTAKIANAHDTALKKHEALVDVLAEVESKNDNEFPTTARDVAAMETAIAEMIEAAEGMYECDYTKQFVQLVIIKHFHTSSEKDERRYGKLIDKQYVATRSRELELFQNCDDDE